MTRRSIELITDRSVCDSQAIYANPDITTLSAAMKIGDTVCPLLGPCMDGELQSKGTKCAAAFGQIMARAVAGGSTYDAELSEIINARMLPPHAKGFVDPDTGDINEITPTQEDAEEAILKWAVRISGIKPVTPSNSNDTPTTIDTTFQALVDSEHTVTIMPNSVSKEVPRNLCRCPIVRVGDYCPVHN